MFRSYFIEMDATETTPRNAPNRGLRAGVTYAIGDILSVGARYAPAILYALFLDSVDYGVFVVVTAISTVFGILVVFGIKGAAFKQSFEYRNSAEKASFYGSMWLFLVLGGIVLTLMTSWLWEKYLPILFGQIPFDPYIRVALWSAYLNGFGIILYEVFRSRSDAAKYVSYSLANAAMLMGFAFLFVGVWRLGLLGALMAPIINGLIWVVIYTIGILPHMNLKFDWKKLASALGYSLPLIPHFIGHWLLNLSDRIILGRLVPIGDIGVYGFGYNVGNLEQVIANSGNSVLMPRYGLAQSDPKARKEISGQFKIYVAWMAAVALAISIFADELIAIFLPESFSGAGAIVPWVALGFFCVALYYGPMNGLTLLAGRTRWVWLFTFTAGAVNIVSNLIFVPVFGIQAAAVNTLVGYFILFLLIYLYARKFDIPTYPWKQIGLVCLGLAAGILIDRLLSLASGLEITSDILLMAGFLFAFIFRDIKEKVLHG